MWCHCLICVSTVGFFHGFVDVISVVNVYVINVFWCVTIVMVVFARLISLGTYMIVVLWILLILRPLNGVKSVASTFGLMAAVIVIGKFVEYVWRNVPFVLLVSAPPISIGGLMDAVRLIILLLLYLSFWLCNFSFLWTYSVWVHPCIFP